jgi:hypothetical protein
VNATALMAKVTGEGGFDTSAADVTPATVLGWINEQYRAMVAAAEWLRGDVTLGPSVAGQGRYSLPDAVVQVSRIAVNGGNRWKRVDEEELYDLSQGASRLYGDVVGVYAEVADLSVTPAVQKIELWPAPSSSGLTISALCSQLPPDLTAPAVNAGAESTPLVPVDVHEHLADGAIGLGFMRVLSRADLATPFLQKYQAGTAMLVKRRRSRAQEGVWQASVGGRR